MLKKVDGMEEPGKTIRLEDGRMLGFAEYGLPQGDTLFYFHGFPGCRFGAGFLKEAAEQLGIRLIGIDRPGIGLSSFKTGRVILDWPDDVVELADSLHIQHFAVAGLSGGGPYALACAYKIPHRLTSCGIISGLGRVSGLISFLSKWLPHVILPPTKVFFHDKDHLKILLKKAVLHLSEPDVQAFNVPDVNDILVASLFEALRQGSKGAAYDGKLLGKQNWGFKLTDIKFPEIYLWHGELDLEIPIATTDVITKQIPQCKAVYYPREGHLSLIVNHAKEILDSLLGK